MKIRKTKVRSAGSWDKSMNLLVIQYYQEITVLRFRLTSTVAVPGKSRGRGRKRRPNPWPESRTAGTYFLKKKFQYMRNVFSRRNVAQHRFSLPLLDYEQQILTSIFWYIWRGAVFGIPLSTLQRRKEVWNWSMSQPNAVPAFLRTE